MDDFADLSRRLESLIRYGAIADVQMVPPRVRVLTGRLTSAWRPWLSLRAGETRDWDPPTIGEQCLLLSPSGDPATGVALVGLFSDDHPAPSSSPDEHVRAFPDGARITYNHVTGALSATGIKTALVQAAQQVTVDCPSTIATGDVLIMGNLTVNGDTMLAGMATVMKLLSYLAGMSGKGGSGGSTSIQGNFKQSGGVLSSNGVVLDRHVHDDPHGGTTGEPK
ncbi:phage baseplate assembly protein V [Chromobacterium haemolyticum]|uniref:phage baseplate assembly protein V n=1 Tax=Chromobacterium haemolyticum TaxID=394935 RepID=UPI00307D3A8E